MPIPSNYVGMLADALVSGFGVFAGTWQAASGAAAAELATLSSTVLGGRTALRLCTVNPRTTREDVEAALARVEQLAATV